MAGADWDDRESWNQSWREQNDEHMIPTYDTKVSFEASKRARAKQEQSSYVRKRDIEKQAQAVKQAVRKTGAAWWEREERQMVWWEDERGSL